MAILKVILYSTQKSLRILYTDTDGIMTSDIENVYCCKCEVLSLRLGGARIKVSNTTRTALLDLEQKYDRATNFHIRKLRGFISKLKDGDYFYYFNEDKTSIVERRIAINCLKLEANGMPFSLILHNHIFEHYSIANILFQYLSYGYDELKERIGEADAGKRVCRFCGKSVPEVTFDKKAHAIQDALGNKHLFCNEECDTCNHDLATVEDQFRIIMDFRRSIFRIPRKDTTKAAKVVGKDFVIQADIDGNPHLYLMQEKLKGVDTAKTFMHHFELKEPIVNEQMYKALCKMVIDMLPSNELSHFENTIRWIKSKSFAPDALPSMWLANLPTNEAVYKQPVLDIFLNNRNVKQETPYCTAIIWIYDIAYLFVVPLVDIDAGKYKYDHKLEPHLKWIKQWTGLNQWQQQDTTNYHYSTPWIDWDVDPTLQNIHILSGTDTIFDECKVEKTEKPDVPMPDVKITDLSLVNIENITFEPYYNAPIGDKDLKDVTQHITQPLYIINFEHEQIKVILEIEANDTTDKVAFFKSGFTVNIHVDRFREFVEFKDQGSTWSFVFHYQLRDLLFAYALAMVEPEMRKLRKGSQFEKCTFDKMMRVSERIIENTLYIIPLEGNKYVKILDSQIHGVE